MEKRGIHERIDFTYLNPYYSENCKKKYRQEI